MNENILKLKYVILIGFEDPEEAKKYKLPNKFHKAYELTKKVVTTVGDMINYPYYRVAQLKMN